MYYYKQIVNKKIVSVEAKSVNVISPHFIKATKAEYDVFIASLPKPLIIPRRDPLAEIDDIKTALGKAGILVVKGE